MARIARVVVPGLPHHITQRGNNRQEVFRSASSRHVEVLTMVVDHGTSKVCRRLRYPNSKPLVWRCLKAFGVLAGQSG